MHAVGALSFKTRPGLLVEPSFFFIRAMHDVIGRARILEVVDIAAVISFAFESLNTRSRSFHQVKSDRSHHVSLLDHIK